MPGDTVTLVTLYAIPSFQLDTDVVDKCIFGTEGDLFDVTSTIASEIPNKCESFNECSGLQAVWAMKPIGLHCVIWHLCGKALRTTFSCCTLRGRAGVSLPTPQQKQLLQVPMLNARNQITVNTIKIAIQMYTKNTSHIHYNRHFHI